MRAKSLGREDHLECVWHLGEEGVVGCRCIAGLGGCCFELHEVRLYGISFLALDLYVQTEHGRHVKCGR